MVRTPTPVSTIGAEDDELTTSTVIATATNTFHALTGGLFRRRMTNEMMPVVTDRQEQQPKTPLIEIVDEEEEKENQKIDSEYLRRTEEELKKSLKEIWTRNYCRATPTSREVMIDLF